MTLPLDALPHKRAGAALPQLSVVAFWLALTALLAVAIVLRHLVAANTDVSWLLTAGERVLGGERLYVDVIETNPPIAVLAYLPAIVMARAVHMPVEAVTDALLFVAILISLGLSASILRGSNAIDNMRAWSFLLAAFAVLAILPAQTFGQREHIAMITLMPMLATMTVRAVNEIPDRWSVIAAGCGAGLTIAFKPHFALGLVCGAGALVLYARSWRAVARPEMAIAAAFVAVYGLCIVIFYPEFFTRIAPLVRDVYIPVGLSLSALLEKPAVPIWCVVVLSAYLLKRCSQLDGPFVLLLGASCGFALAFFLQRKGWPYHSYPMIALALLALAYTLATEPFQRRLDRILGVAALAIGLAAFTGAMRWFDYAFDARPLDTPVASLGPHPAILAITAEPGIGHPLTRAVGGTWVSRQQGLWVAGYLQHMKAQGELDSAREAMIAPYAARERAMLIEDILQRPPTVVLVDRLSGNWDQWLRDNPDIARLLEPYRLVQTVNRIDVLAKR